MIDIGTGLADRVLLRIQARIHRIQLRNLKWSFGFNLWDSKESYIEQKQRSDSDSADSDSTDSDSTGMLHFANGFKWDSDSDSPGIVNVVSDSDSDSNWNVSMF